MRDVGSAEAGSALRGSPLVPRVVSDALLTSLDGAAAWLVRAGVSANAVTVTSLVFAAVGGVSLALGCFALAAPAMALACLGDALDGLVARRSASTSVGGALLDAAVDRYGEFFFLGGLAVYFRESATPLVLCLLALCGSFMVSYASAKAEALHRPVPPGLMRRPERAICLCVGVALAAVLGQTGSLSGVPGWAVRAALVVAVGVLAVFANGSAVRRLRLLAQSGPQAALAKERTLAVAPRALDRFGPSDTREPNAVAAPRALRAR